MLGLMVGLSILAIVGFPYLGGQVRLGAVCLAWELLPGSFIGVPDR
jgi:hypothetical protein